jgi:uncharacterized protein YjbI with pentapeptide repeats
MERAELPETDQKRSRATVLWIFLGTIAGAVLLYVLWRLLNNYIDPGDDPTQRKDVVQAFAVIVGGLAAFGTLLVGWRNLRNNQKTLQVQQKQLQVQQGNTQSTLEQQRTIEEQRAQDTILQEYFDLIGELLLKEDLLSTNKPLVAMMIEAKEDPLSTNKPLAELRKALDPKKTRNQTVRSLANEHTRTALRRLNGERKGFVIQFLASVKLITRYRPEESSVLGLHGADLRGAILRNSVLAYVELFGVRLSNADFTGADLYRANLSSADLSGAKLTASLVDTNLENTNLSGADLSDAAMSDEQLNAAWSLEGATMPDRSTHD